MAAKIEVTCSLNIYPSSSELFEGRYKPPIVKFRNHWNDPNRVVLIIGDREYELIGEEIERAVKCVRLAH